MSPTGEEAGKQTESTPCAPFVRERGRYALIPAFFGIAFAGLGALGLKDRFRLPSAYGGIVLSVVGLLGSVSGIPKVIAYLGGEEVARPAASIAQAVMAVVLLVLIVSLVKFVIAERRQA